MQRTVSDAIHAHQECPTASAVQVKRCCREPICLRHMITMCQPILLGPVALQVLELHLEYPRPLLPGAGRQYKQAAGKMAAFMHFCRLAPGEVRIITQHAAVHSRVASFPAVQG
jgi:hypothetical protein